MIDSADAGSMSPVSLLTPGEKADTAAATGSWVSVSGYEGQIVFVQHVGAVTAGSIAGKIQSASDDQGTGAADIATFTSVTTSNDNPNAQRASVPARACGAYVRYLGTITTGPAVVGVEMLASPKSV